MTQYGTLDVAAASDVCDDASTTPAARASNAAKEIARRSAFMGCPPHQLPSAPVAGADRRRSGRDLTMIIDVLHAVAAQVSRRLKACLIVGVCAQLRRTTGPVAATAHDA